MYKHDKLINFECFKKYIDDTYIIKTDVNKYIDEIDISFDNFTKHWTRMVEPEIKNIDEMEINEDICIPHYLSTSFNQEYACNYFLRLLKNPVLFKITIPTNNNDIKWMPLFTLSIFPNECEILLNKNMIYNLVI